MIAWMRELLALDAAPADGGLRVGDAIFPARITEVAKDVEWPDPEPAPVTPYVAFGEKRPIPETPRVPAAIALGLILGKMILVQASGTLGIVVTVGLSLIVVAALVRLVSGGDTLHGDGAPGKPRFW